jgi:hypothetical protein
MLAVKWEKNGEWEFMPQLVSRFFPCCESTTKAEILWQRGQSSSIFCGHYVLGRIIFFILSMKLCVGNPDFYIKL